MKIKLNLDSQRLQAKPEPFDGRLRNRLCNAASITEVTPEELMEAIQKGRTFTPAVMTGTTGDTWQEQQVICADIDNDESRKDEAGNWIRDENGKTKKFLIDNPITPDRAADIMREYGIDPYFMYYSFRSKPEWPKFRIVLILDEPIKDKAAALDLEARFTGIFNRAELRSADTTNSDSARLYYGSRPDSVFYHSGQTTSRALLSALPEPPEKPIEEPKRPNIAPKPKPAQKITPAARNAGKRTFDELQAQLRADIEAFDLAEYVRTTTASRPVRRGRSLFFNPCPVCGHNDDFQVTGSLYHCHSASGGTGGTIIDFLMNRHGISRAEALEKFKFEIMRYDRDEWRRAYREMKKAEEEAARRAPFTGPDLEAYEMTEEEIQAALDAEAAEYEEYLQTPEGQAEAAETAEYWAKQATGGADPEEQVPEEPEKDALEAFLEEIQTRQFEPISTGIKDIDRALYGGFLRRTLVTLAAAPGAGKTALAQWIFENMAASGKDVLYINLEMDRAQLLARSISRLAWQRSEDKQASLSALNVLRAYEWTPAQQHQITAAIDEYRQRIAPHFTYNPDTLKGTVNEMAGNDIRRIIKAMQDEVDRTKAAGRPEPIICIDYLQIVTAPGNTAAEQIQTIIKLLKDFAIENNTVVFLITAQNRAANKAGASEMESGRDTSAIEYSGDLMLGLVYTAIENGETWTYYKRDEAGKVLQDKNGNPKKVTKAYDLDRIRELQRKAYDNHEEPDPVCTRLTLKVLKNRFGAAEARANFIFDGKHGTFHQIEHAGRKDEEPRDIWQQASFGSLSGMLAGDPDSISASF